MRNLLSALVLAALLSAAAGAETRPVTLLFTNDFESAFDPTEAYWREDIEYIGGIAHLATLIEQYRDSEETTFLFDAGDIFTGTLSKLTKGELPFELMITLDYDAMSIGNHEFEYGWLEFAAQKNRASFPVLGANLYYKGTDHPYAQPWAIVERNGIRIGVIGILGRDAATALIPSNIAGVDVRDPAPIVTELVRMLRPDVDLVVLLTHQGETAPMQTDDEGRPEVRRDIDADIALAGVVAGIDVLLGGHADAGTREPVVHPETGTIIMQTFGQGQHLGVLRLDVDVDGGGVENFDGRLVTVDSNALAPHRLVQEKIDRYRSRFREYYEPIATTESGITRRYDTESDLGNLFADILRI
ncbi:MAG: metallophosphatase, partial [Gammaproteobacteria bacterium]|nr:metallophosphatase [Gammaproteobacteria bacterium]